MIKKTIAICSVIMLTACTDAKEATRALESAGYSDIQTGGYGWFMCGRDDIQSTEFTAVNPAGKKTSGVVCSGLIFKSSTIRH